MILLFYTQIAVYNVENRNLEIKLTFDANIANFCGALVYSG
jgi:hypothetical protein